MISHDMTPTVRHGALRALRMIAIHAAFILLAFGWFSAASPAKASLQFCNHTSFVLRTAAALPHPDDGWRIQGWLQLWPGECRQIARQLAAIPSFYIYSESHSAHQGPVRRWSGERQFCVRTDQNFEFLGPDACDGVHDYRSFFRVQVEAGSTQWIHRFREPSSKLATLRSARTSGLQRLLKEADFFKGRIDGYMGRRTRQAARAAQRSLKLTKTGIDSTDLMAGLLGQIQSQQSEKGFRFCNETNYRAWAAVAYEQDQEWISKGWWAVDPQACVRVIKDGLPNQFLYAYAEADTRNGWQVQWQGSHPFCVSEVKFEIDGSEGCETRGYGRANFIRINTADKTAWEFALREDDAEISPSTEGE